MKKTFICLLAAGLCYVFCSAQSETPLKGKTKLQKSISGDAIHTYTVQLQKDQFFFATITDPESDLIVSVYNDLQEKIDELDDNGINGEFVSIFAQRNGTYSFQVKPFTKEEKVSNYTLEVTKKEAVAASAAGKLDQYLSIYDQPNTPGFAIAIVKEGKVLYQREFGLANLEYSIPITENSVFDLASVAKLITATAIGLLVENNQLTLADDVRKYVPEVPDFGTTITIKHLLTHTSGIRDIAPLSALNAYTGQFKLAHALDIVSRQEALNFQPGTKTSYSNSNFNILAAVVERITQQSFRQWAQTHIFEPLEMHQTFINDDPQAVIKNRVYAYNSHSGRYFFDQNNIMSLTGSSALFSTSNDLIKWLKNFNQPKVGGKKTLEIVSMVGEGNFKGLNMIEHSGSSGPGFRSSLAYFPDHQFGVAIISNWGAISPIQMIGKKIIELYLGEHFQQKPSQPAVSAPSSIPPSTNQIHPPNLEQFTGRYNFKDEDIITFSTKDGQLFAQPEGGPLIQLQTLGDDQFFVPPLNATIKFEAPQDGKASKAVFKNGEQVIAVAPRIREKSSSNEMDLTRYVGDYFSDEMQFNIRVDYKNNQLTFFNPRREKAILHPKSTGGFETRHPWRLGHIEFNPGTSDQPTKLVITVSEGAQNVVFRRWRKE